MNKHYESKIASEQIFNGKIINVTRDEVLLENGAHSYREVVHHNGGAAVIAIDENDNITLIKQYRYPADCELIEIPAGKLEKDENPFEAAKRELAEEAGIVADTYIDLGFIIPTCGYCSEKIFIYAAKGLHTVPQHLDIDEFVTVFTMPLALAVDAVMQNEIKDSKTAIAILKLKQLKDENKF
ncbi:MAG: NUDIX hydrolase [Oscillospiraceae bacterium]